MTLLSLYEAVCRQTDMSEGRFLSLLRQTVTELTGEYKSDYVLLSPTEYAPDLLDMHTDAPFFDEYGASVLSGILYLDNMERTELREKSYSERKAAYLLVWKKKNRRKYAAAKRPWG